MKTVRTAIVLAVFALLGAACGGGDDDTTRDENGNVIEGGEIGVFSLNVGDCFGDLPVGQVSEIDAVPCAEDHLYEIYHLFDVAMEEFDSGAIQQASQDGCAAAFESFTGVSIDTSFYTFEWLQPSATSWAADDREVVCFVTPFNGQTTAGTAKGAGLVREQALADTTTTTAPEVVEETTTTVAEETTTAPPTTGTSGGTQSVFELSVGECYVELPTGTQVGEIEAIDCNQPHGIEIMHLFDLELAAYDAEAVGELALEGCLAAFEPYMGAAYEVSWYELDWLQPSPGSWDAGDREVVCVVFPFDENITQSVGSARGQGRLLGE